jgi:hypothetical protein
MGNADVLLDTHMGSCVCAYITLNNYPSSTAILVQCCFLDIGSMVKCDKAQDLPYIDLRNLAIISICWSNINVLLVQCCFLIIGPMGEMWKSARSVVYWSSRASQCEYYLLVRYQCVIRPNNAVTILAQWLNAAKRNIGSILKTENFHWFNTITRYQTPQWALNVS